MEKDGLVVLDCCGPVVPSSRENGTLRGVAVPRTLVAVLWFACQPACAQAGSGDEANGAGPAYPDAHGGGLIEAIDADTARVSTSGASGGSSGGDDTGSSADVASSSGPPAGDDAAGSSGVQGPTLPGPMQTSNRARRTRTPVGHPTRVTAPAPRAPIRIPSPRVRRA